MHFDVRLLRAAVLLTIVGVAVACGRADAKASESTADAAKPSTATVPTGTQATPTPTVIAAPRAGEPRDTVKDSVLIAAADKGRLMGPDSGAIWLVVMSDFQCPYCKTWHDSSMAQLTRDYVKTGKVRLAYLNLPLQMHPHARREAEASMCAAAQRQFWEFSAALFRDQRKVAVLTEPTEYLDSVAREVSLDMQEYTRCTKSQSIRALVESDIQQATKMGIRSTPSFLIGDFLIEGALPYADFRRAVDSALSVARSKRSR